MQIRPRLAPSGRVAFRSGLAVWLLLACAGCDHVTANPVSWFHDLQGGAIAQQRPEPPLADAPYPNLATVPNRPQLPDAGKRAVMMQALVADRTKAEADAAQAPLVAVPPASPRTPVPTAPQASSDDGASAQMQAASAKPRPVTPVATTAAAPESAALSPSPATAPMSGAEKVSHPVAEGTPAEPLASLPAMAEAPPPMPDFARPVAPSGSLQLISKAAAASLPIAVAQAGPMPVAADPAIPPAAPRLNAASTSVEIGFDPGSDTLPGSALAQLKLLSRTRGLGTIVVTGHGDVDSTDAQSQAAGLPLALARARAIAAYLMATGVPPGSVTITAEAQGHGGVARINN